MGSGNDNRDVIWPKGNGADWTHWHHVLKCELWHAAILTVRLDPRAFALRPDDHLVVMLSPGSVTADTMNAINSHIGIAISHIGDGFASHNNWFEPTPSHRKRTKIALPDFGRWAAPIWPDLHPDFPRYEQAPMLVATPGWPWGTFETPLLKELAAAVQHFWTNYKPESAPTKDQVVDWLVKRGRTLNEATAIAKIIRPPDLPDGPRVKRDKRNG